LTGFPFNEPLPAYSPSTSGSITFGLNVKCHGGHIKIQYGDRMTSFSMVGLAWVENLDSAVRILPTSALEPEPGWPVAKY
jgi:hypothetical protein